MSSWTCSSIRERLAAGAIVGVVFATGCGSVPEPRTPLRMVPVDAEHASSPTAVCACDDDDDDDEVARDVSAKVPVEYVRLSEWQPPASVARLESEISARGDVPRTYVQFPKLSLHRPIGETTIRPIFQGPYAVPIGSSDPAYLNRPASNP